MDTDDLRNEVLSCGRRARVAARALTQMSTERKNAGLLAMADQLCASANTILQANGKDVEKATTDQLSYRSSTGLNSMENAFRRWRTTFVRSLRSRIRSEKSSPNGFVPMACTFQKCASPLGRSESSTSRARMS